MIPVFLLIIIPFSYARPVINNNQINQQFDFNLLLSPNLFEGDIILEASENRFWRNAVGHSSLLWSNGVIPYVIDASLNDIKEHIDAALQHIEERTCIRFKKRTIEEDYVKYFKGPGCFAHAGRRGGQQTVSIGNGCDYHGIIVHETMHSIGFHHMHTRSDRDKYLTIFWENIAQNYINQFIVQKPEELQLLTPFDYDSIMMYGSRTGSYDSKSITMLRSDLNSTLIEAYEKPGLSAYDIIAINKLYKCPTETEASTTEASTTENSMAKTLSSINETN